MIPRARYKRQETYRIFASEFSGSSLTEQKSEEYAPAFIISKIGAKVNRAMVCGVVENIERRDGDSGSSYNFAIRDPTGVIRLNIAPFQPELHPTAEEMLLKFDSGERFLILFVGKSRWFESEDGGVFTSLRVEECCVIERERYLSWLTSTADATLRRIDTYNKALEVGLDEGEMRAAKVPEDLIPGIIAARNHYQKVDTEEIKLGVLKAISLVVKGTDPVEESADSQEVDNPGMERIDDSHEINEQLGNAEPIDVILGILSSNGGDLVGYDDLVAACVSAGSSGEAAEDAIEHLRDVTMEISEPRFGFFSISS
ncbi:MAG: hypothetical protein CMB60_01710 [Euryarchaeota archaeon]|nr:hypothetical protein [Euryarchaeota archaeon]